MLYLFDLIFSNVVILVRCIKSILIFGLNDFEQCIFFVIKVVVQNVIYILIGQLSVIFVRLAIVLVIILSLVFLSLSSHIGIIRLLNIY